MDQVTQCCIFKEVGGCEAVLEVEVFIPLSSWCASFTFLFLWDVLAYSEKAISLCVPVDPCSVPNACLQTISHLNCGASHKEELVGIIAWWLSSHLGFVWRDWFVPNHLSHGTRTKHLKFTIPNPLFSFGQQHLNRRARTKHLMSRIPIPPFFFQ